MTEAEDAPDETCVSYHVTYARLDDLHGALPRTHPAAGHPPPGRMPLFSLTRLVQARATSSGDNEFNDGEGKDPDLDIVPAPREIPKTTQQQQQDQGTQGHPQPPPLDLGGARSGCDGDLRNPVMVGVDEDRGTVPYEGDKAWREHERAVKQTPWRQYVPSIFARPLLRELSAYAPDEVLQGVDAADVAAALRERRDWARLRVVQLDLGARAPAGLQKRVRQWLKRVLTPAAAPCVEVVVVRHAGLRRCGALHHAGLRVCDVAGNALENVAELERLAGACPALETLNALENPVACRQDFFSRVIGAAPRLAVLNGKPISVELRCRCLDLLGSRAYHADREFYRWDLCLCRVPAVARMRTRAPYTWQPAALTKLILADQGLECLHVGALVGLTLLHVPNNRIRTLAGAGLEQLAALADLDVSNNLLVDRADLAVLQHLPALRTLALAGNNLPPDYLADTLFHTRNLAGTNRSTGLVTLNGVRVTLEMRVHAMAHVASRIENKAKKSPSTVARKDKSKSKSKRKDKDKGKKEDDGAKGDEDEKTDEDEAEDDEEEDEGKKREHLFSPSKYHWNLALMQTFGHVQMRAEDFVARVVDVDMCGLGLTYANFSRFVAVRALRLARNDLAVVHGLGALAQLEHLDLLDNARLDVAAVAAELSATTTLRALALGVTAPTGSSRHVARAEHRRALIDAYAFRNPRLAFVDGRPLSVPEYADALHRADPARTPDDLQRYRLALAVAVGHDARALPAFTPESVVAAIAVGASTHESITGAVTRLDRLNGLGLAQPPEAGFFAAFARLRVLNLARNGLTDLAALGLAGLAHLRALDVSHNRIATPLAALAATLDALPALQAVALRGNPALAARDARPRLLALLRGVRDPARPLRVVDREITLDERLAAIAAATGTTEPDAVARLCTAFALLHVVPAGAPAYGAVGVLDLRALALATLDVAPFRALHTLLLRGNHFARISLDACPATSPHSPAGDPPSQHPQGPEEEESLGLWGLGACTALTALDLRDNRLASLDAVAGAVARLARLQAVGVAGNAFRGLRAAPGSRRHRALVRPALLARLPALWTAPGCALGRVDDAPITVAEIVDAAAASTAHNHEAQAQGPSVLARGRGVAMCRVAVLRRAPAGVGWAALVELRLDGCGLTELRLGGLGALQRLSLAHNAVDAPHLLRGGLDRLACLAALDLRDNRVRDRRVLWRALARVPALERVWLIPNPCYPQDTPRYRRRFAELGRPGAQFVLVDGFGDAEHQV